MAGNEKKDKWNRYHSLDDVLQAIESSPNSARALKLDGILVKVEKREGKLPSQDHGNGSRSSNDDAIYRLVDALLRPGTPINNEEYGVDLERLSLQRNNLGPDGARYLRSYIEEKGEQEHFHSFQLLQQPPAVSNLRWLYLNDNRLGPEGARHIAAAIRAGNGRLEILDLKSNAIGPSGAASIASVLRLPPAGKECGIEGILVAARREACGITHLGLRDNGLGRNGAIAIADALGSNETVQVLDLVGNGIGDTGASAIADSFHENRTLKCLALDSNDVGDPGALALAVALESNSTMNSLPLRNNPITDVDLQDRIQSGLRKNKAPQEGFARSQGSDRHPPTVRQTKKSSSKSGRSAPPSNEPRSGSATGKSGGGWFKGFSAKGNAKTNKTTVHRQQEINAKAGTEKSNERKNASSSKESAPKSPPEAQEDKEVAKVEGSKPDNGANEQEETASSFEEEMADARDFESPPYPSVGDDDFDVAHQGDDEDDEMKLGRAAMREVLRANNVPPKEVPAKYVISLIGEEEDGGDDGGGDSYGRRERKRELLGKGAFGAVFRGYDQKLRRHFAVKVINPQSNSGGEEKILERNLRMHALNTFKREVNAHLCFCHPNIARLFVYHMSRDKGGTHFLVFELAEKGTLQRFLQDSIGRERLSWRVRLKVAFDLASALHHLHESGSSQHECLHRDIKPGNVCITSNFSAKLIDCGLAKIVETSPSEDQDEDGNRALNLFSMISGTGITGTPQYMDPKLFFARRYIAAFDVFSLGIVFLELLTGRLQAGASHADNENDFNNVGESSRDDSTSNHTVISANTADSDQRVNLVEIYVRGEMGREPRDVRKDADQLAGDWNEGAKDTFAKIATDCLCEGLLERPKISAVAIRLRQLVATHCAESFDPQNGVNDSGTTSCKPEGGHDDCASFACSMCPASSAVLRCHPVASGAQDHHHHYICRVCFVRTVDEQINRPHIECPVPGCVSTPFTYQEISDNAGAEMLVGHLEASRTTKALNRLENFGKTLNDLRQLQRNQLAVMAGMQKEYKKDMRIVKASLAHLRSAGCTSVCPRLVWIVPGKEQGNLKSLYGPSQWKPIFLRKKVKLFFVCEHTHEIIKPPLELWITRDFMVTAAFFIKLTLLSLRAIALSGLIVLPLPDGSIQNALKTMESFVDGALDKEVRKYLDAMSHDVDPTTRDGEVVIPHEIVGKAYDVLAEKVRKPKRLRQWQDKIEPILVDDGRRLAWVKSDYANVLSTRG